MPTLFQFLPVVKDKVADLLQFSASSTSVIPVHSHLLYWQIKCVMCIVDEMTKNIFYIILVYFYVMLSTRIWNQTTIHFKTHTAHFTFQSSFIFLASCSLQMLFPNIVFHSFLQVFTVSFIIPHFVIFSFYLKCNAIWNNLSINICDIPFKGQ